MPACFVLANAATEIGDVVYGVADNGVLFSSRAKLLVFNPAASDISQCAFVAPSGAEYKSLQTSSGSAGTVQTPMPQNYQELGNLSIADAQVISGYVGLLWAGVWGFKQIIKFLSVNERNEDE